MEITNTIKRVKLSPKVNYNGFAEAFENLPRKHILIVRRELQKRLGWSTRNFQYKRSGDSPIRVNEVPTIEEVFARFNLNPWTGERI
jgi:hypothetical protein